MGDAIRLSDLTLGYDRHPAVHHVSGVFAEGSLTAIVGPNGAGKTTLLKGIVGLLRPLAGVVELCGVRPADVAYLPQQADIERTFPISVMDTVLLGHWRRVGAFGAVTRKMADQARHALALVGLEDFARRPLGTLSSGQVQRALFARLMLQDARLILLDEPFAAVDARTTGDLIELIGRWHGERRTIIAVLHDVELVRVRFAETLLLAREVIAWGRTAEVLTPAALRRTRAMAEAWDDDAELCAQGAA